MLVLTSGDIMLERQGLIQTFNKFKNHRIIAVCAPAGYGKTVAVTEWLSKGNRVKAVFSLDEYDNNLAGFCERFCATLLTCQPRNQTFREIVCHPSFQSAPDEFTLRAVGILSGRKQTVLAIDDLHLITDNTILHLLLVSIKRLPPNFQIILISRYDLPPIFLELRLRGQLARIDAKQFIFSNDEIKALYNMRDTPITNEQANEINQQTHGWAMGINAFLLSGKESFETECDYISDFMQANLWNKWDDDTRDFMLRTSNLRELTPSLCAHMTGMSNCDEFLKELVQKGVFITQVQKGVYRYHHLFQQFLKHMTNERVDDFTASLLEKEGEWHLSQKDFYNAIDCFIQCENHDGVVECFDFMETSGLVNFAIGRFLPVLNQPVFQEATRKSPHLIYFMVYNSLAEGRYDDTIFFMDEYYSRYPEIVANNPALAHSIIYMRFLDFRIPITQIPNKTEIPEDTSIINLRKWQLSMHMPLFHRGVIDYSIEADLDVVSFMENELLAKTSWAFGSMAPLFVEIIIVGLLYERGDLEKAYSRALRINAKMNTITIIDTKLCAKYILVRILDAVGETNEASLVIESISALIETNKAYQLSPNFNAFDTNRKIAQGDIKAAECWLEAQTLTTPTFWGIYTAFTTCRAFIATMKYDRAIILLRAVLELALAFNRIHDIIDAKILLAIACWKKKRGFQNEALEHLEKAIVTAYPYGYIQMFITEGAALSSILYKLQRSVEHRETNDKEHLVFIRMLYLKTRGISNDALEDGQGKTPIKFTDKQRVVMSMLSQGKRQKEIAEAMGIKQTTLRYHIESVYNKLGVSNVADAVTKINALKLLELSEDRVE